MWVCFRGSKVPGLSVVSVFFISRMAGGSSSVVRAFMGARGGHGWRWVKSQKE